MGFAYTPRIWNSVFGTDKTVIRGGFQVSYDTFFNNLLSNSIGTPSGNDITRGKFVLSMVPATPTDADLREGYIITATRNVTGEGNVYQYELTQAGEIRQVLP